MTLKPAPLEVNSPKDAPHGVPEAEGNCKENDSDYKLMGERSLDQSVKSKLERMDEKLEAGADKA